MQVVEIGFALQQFHRCIVTVVSASGFPGKRVAGRAIAPLALC
jgi:hypothetical protein